MSNLVAWVIAVIVSAYPGYRFAKYATDNFRFGVASDNFLYFNMMCSGMFFCGMVLAVRFLITLIMGVPF